MTEVGTTAAGASGRGTGDPVDRALQLWSQPIRPGEGGLADFAAAYADPVVINGAVVPLPALVDRARATQAALPDLRFELLDRFDAGDRCAIAFRQAGTLVGPLPGAPPPVAPRPVEGMGMDLFTLVDDRIARIWVVSELLAALGGTAPSSADPGQLR